VAILRGAGENLRQVLAEQEQEEQEHQGVQEKACRGRRALGAGDPRTGNAASQLVGGWAGDDGESDSGNNKVIHVLLEFILNSAVEDESVLLIFLVVLVVLVIPGLVRVCGDDAIQEPGEDQKDEGVQTQTGDRRKSLGTGNPRAKDAAGSLEGLGARESHKSNERYNDRHLLIYGYINKWPPGLPSFSSFRLWSSWRPQSIFCTKIHSRSLRENLLPPRQPCPCRATLASRALLGARAFPDRTRAVSKCARIWTTM